MPVPLLDLKAQYDTIRDRIEEVVAEIFESQYFVLGPNVEAFEEEVAEYLAATEGTDGSPEPDDAPLFAIGCASGTDALLLPLKIWVEESCASGDARDEVIAPAFTFFATAGAIWNSGFKPAFCDVDPDTFNVTPATVEAAATSKTRGVVPVHLFGQMAPMAPLLEWAADREAFVLEDAAQAIGARQRIDGVERQAGTIGDVGAYSFFPTKNLGGAGDGGLMTTRDPEMAEALRKFRVHGGRQMYRHERVGTNSRLDALQAAVLRVKLPHLDGWAAGRRENACRYEGLLEGLDEVTLPAVDEGNFHVYNQFTLRVEARDELRAFLNDRDIGSGIYYPVPLHLQECFAELGYRKGDLPVSERLCDEVLSLPIYPELSEEQIEEVGAAIREFYAGR